MNIVVRVSFRTMCFSRYMTKSGIAGSYGSPIFSIFKEPPYCSPQWLHQFTFPPRWSMEFLFLISLFKPEKDRWITTSGVLWKGHLNWVPKHSLWEQIVYPFPVILIRIEIYIFMGQILGQGSERFPWKWTDRPRSIVYKLCFVFEIEVESLSSCVHAHLLQLCLTLPPDGLGHQAPLSMGILRARILEWVAMPSSRGSSRPGIQAMSPVLQVDTLPLRKNSLPLFPHQGSLSLVT